MLDTLVQTFCQDCSKRILRISGVVQDAMPLTREQLDQLHQEFDTLYGGARAVNLPDLEHFFRIMARYARYLRNRQMHGLEVDVQDWQRLLMGIEMGRQCSGELSKCLKHCNSKLPQLLQEIAKIINNGDAK